MASASKELSGAYDHVDGSEGEEGLSHAPEGSRRSAAEDRPAIEGDVSSTMVLKATQDGSHGWSGIEPPGKHFVPKDPSAVSISFLPPEPYRSHRHQY